MGSKALKGRDNWQGSSGANAGAAEKSFLDVMKSNFVGTEFCVRAKPKEFRQIYSKMRLSDDVLKQIYNPDETWIHGVIPDFAIDNTKNGKKLYVEVKRQDGWVEGKQRKDGRGNAHERSCKFFTPGLLASLRSEGKLGVDVLPFWVVFQGDIARDPKRVREITHWYEGVGDHFFLWSDSTNPSPLLDHFETKLKKLLL